MFSKTLYLVHGRKRGETMKLEDLLKGYNGDINGLITLINNNAKEMKAKVFIDDGKDNIYVPKARLDAKIVELSELKSKLNENGEGLKNLEKLTKDNELAQETIKTLQSDLAEYKKKSSQSALNYAVSAAALEYGALDKTGGDILHFIDKSKVAINDDGSIAGLKEQLDVLKENKPYLFGKAPQVQEPPKGTGTPGKPGSGSIFDAKSSKEGMFGELLADQFKGSTKKEIDSDYFFKK